VVEISILSRVWVTGRLLWLVCMFETCCQLYYVWSMIMWTLSVY